MVQKQGGPQKKKGKAKGCLLGCLGAVGLFVILIGGMIVYSAKDWRSDETVLTNYQPSVEMEEIAEKNMLTDKGKADFYRANPKMVDGDTFGQECLANGIESLACNTGFKIFLLDVEDPRFADHKYAAAVHEMLHIAYRRLESDEKQSLNALLEQELAKNSGDPHLTGVIDTLQANGREADVNEELHSKFGVEYASVSPALEEYYEQYFKDRATVVALYNKGGFNKRVRRMEEIAVEVKALEAKINAASDQATANGLINQYNAKAAESRKLYGEIQEFYGFFNSGYQPPSAKVQ